MESSEGTCPAAHVIHRWYSTCLSSDKRPPSRNTAMAAIKLTSLYWKIGKFGYRVGVVEMKQMVSS